MAVPEPKLQPVAPAFASNPGAETGGTLTVDLAAIEANWRALARRVVTVECAAVVKADAYGCGLEPVTTKLAKAGCKTFFVADLAEARRVRAVAPDAVVYVLNGFAPESDAAFMELNARPVINSVTELAEWDAFVAGRNWRGGAALHVDTGMNRLGVTVPEAMALASRVHMGNHGITLLMSHLACAEIPDHALNERQIKMFRDLRMMYRGVAASLANSSGIFLGNSAHCDVARPGAALYGVNPTPKSPNPMRSVVELTGRVAQVRSVERGESVGYGATWSAKRATHIAIVTLGYADGILRSLGSADRARGGSALIAGKSCPFVGRVSMDSICVDVTDLPDGAARRGIVATLIGDKISVDEFAAAAGTIGYEILTGLGRRCHRVYLDG
jgi:alanine racemase